MPRSNRNRNDRTCEFCCKQSTSFSRNSDYERHLKEQHLPKKSCPSSGCDHPPEKRIGRLIKHAQEEHTAEYQNIAAKLKDDENQGLKRLLQTKVISVENLDTFFNMTGPEHDFVGDDMSDPMLPNDEQIDSGAPYYSVGSSQNFEAIGGFCDLNSDLFVTFPANFDRATQDSAMSLDPPDNFLYHHLDTPVQADLMAASNNAWAIPEEYKYLTPQQNNPSVLNFAT
ncbi:hypothetical protein HYALB_00001540 [Hymenoscyphus albidus]|uniref:Uncharacterized protein n=1 Tax=Hymenoscyphus albidus TaxID=595503 RepID=A0A9N9PWL1_9HELO|nr:hypothetical protein HYALB_00001540 [Hymenoscyphus albidus]